MRFNHSLLFLESPHTWAPYAILASNMSCRITFKVRSENVSCTVVSDSLRPHGLYPARLLCPWNSPGKNIGVGKLFPSPGDLPDPRIKSKSPTSQADSLPFESPGKFGTTLKAGIKSYCLTSRAEADGSPELTLLGLRRLLLNTFCNNRHKYYLTKKILPG